MTDCNEKKIKFIYAISPGLDIKFSDEKEIEKLGNKLLQVIISSSIYFVLIFNF